MKNKKIFVGILLIVLIGIMDVHAQTDLADWHYERAVEAYNRGDCVNASVHVSAAFDRYTAEGDLVGVAKCNDLIKKVNDCLRPLGDSHYLQALDYFFKGEQYLNSGDYVNAREQFDFAAIYLQRANSTYQRMLPVDPERIVKVNTQYGQVSVKIRDGEIMKAGEFYSKALIIIEEEDYKKYTTALLYVDNASVIYQRYGVEESVQDCVVIRKKIIDLIAEAAEHAGFLYEKGIQAYQSANCSNEGFFEARTYFENSRNTYILINYFDRAEDCNTILLQVNDSISNCREGMLKSLDAMIKEAKTKRALIPKGNCSAYAEVEDLVNTAKERAVELYEVFRTGNFLSREKECEELLKKIEEDKEECETTGEAEEIYVKAYNLFQQAEYEDSLKLAEKAREIFEKNSDFGGVTKSERLIDDNNRMLLRLDESNTYYEKGLEYYEVADFDNALRYVLKARGIYEEISRSSEAEICNSTIKDIRNGNETKNRAKAYYEEALRYYDYRDYGTALENAVKARDLYKKINYAEGLENAEQLIKKIPERENDIPLIPLLVVASMLLILLLWSRTKISRARKKKEAESEEKRLVEEKREKEREVERRRREAEKARMMKERERLREIVEEEKKKAIGREEVEVEGEAVDGETEEAAVEVDDREMLEEMIKREEEAIRREEDGLSVEEDTIESEKELESERARLEEMIEQESESIKRERAAVSDQIEWEKGKISEMVDKGKDVLAREKKEVIDDREKIKEVIEREEDTYQPEKESTEKAGLKEMIKKERKSVKKGKD